MNKVPKNVIVSERGNLHKRNGGRGGDVSQVA